MGLIRDGWHRRLVQRLLDLGDSWGEKMCIGWNLGCEMDMFGRATDGRMYRVSVCYMLLVDTAGSCSTVSSCPVTISEAQSDLQKCDYPELEAGLNDLNHPYFPS